MGFVGFCGISGTTCDLALLISVWFSRRSLSNKSFSMMEYSLKFEGKIRSL